MRQMWRPLQREAVTYNGVTIRLAPQVVNRSELLIEIGGQPFMVLVARLKSPSSNRFWQWRLLDSPGLSAAMTVFERVDANVIHKFRKNGEAPTEHQAKRSAEAVIFGLAAMAQRCDRYLKTQQQLEELTRQLIAVRSEQQNNPPHAWWLGHKKANKPDSAWRTMPPEVEAACLESLAAIKAEEDVKAFPPPAPRRNPGNPAGE